MKTNNPFLMLLIPAVMLFACRKAPPPISDYKPILMERSELENSIKLTAPKEISDYGKIYIKDNLLYINEKYEGVHVIDNSNPSNPVSLAFLSIPGNVDISIKDNIIYADNAVDLVSLKYENNSLTEVNRDRNVFPELLPPDGRQLDEKYNDANRPDNTIIIKYVEQ